jgi:hypothetical protein
MYLKVRLATSVISMNPLTFVGFWFFSYTFSGIFQDGSDLTICPALGKYKMASMLMAPASNDGLVTVDMGGCIRVWETALINIERSLEEWRRMIGFGENKPLQVTYDKTSGLKVLHFCYRILLSYSCIAMTLLSKFLCFLF